MQGICKLIAYKLSRFITTSQDFHLCPKTFALICRHLERPVIDHFASPLKTQVEVFCSRGKEIGVRGVHAFSCQLYAFFQIPLFLQFSFRVKRDVWYQ